MKMYLAGAEVPSHRRVMTELGVSHVALSYMGLRRRVKFARPWIIADHVSPTAEVFLDSGAHTVNREGGETYTDEDLKDIARHYQRFVTDNLDRLTLVSEFDALQLGTDWIQDRRTDFYDHLPPEKFLPIWHAEHGLDVLSEMATRYRNIGITSTSLQGLDLAPVLNKYAQAGLRLHGVGITSVDAMYAIRWHSVASTSWLSPQHYGDTIVWTGRELKRYPKKTKAQARKRHRTLFQREGFDPDRIEADDSTELLRLSAWSWQQLVTDIERKHPTDSSSAEATDSPAQRLRIVAPQHGSGSPPNPEETGSVVEIPTGQMRNRLPTPGPKRATTPLPVLGVTRTTEQVTTEDGGTEEIEVERLGIRSDSTRMCSACFLATKCPAYEANSNCAYDIPIEIKTRDQFLQIQNSIIEMQTQRVLFMRFAEETEGGYADPNLSSEIDRLQQLLKAKHDMEDDSLSIRFEAKGGNGGAGMLARLFGEQASEKARALEQPVPADDFIEAEVLGDWDREH